MTVLANRAVILGTGLIGASLAAAGRRAGALKWVIGVGRGRANLDRALASGSVDEVSQDASAAVARADLVVLAAPADACVELLTTVARHAPDQCVVTDVASVKVPVCLAARQAGLGDRFVGGHPIAGSEASGASAAHPDLFKDRTVVLTPSGAQPVALAKVRELWERVGATVIEMEPALHDATVAISSHLPQMLAFALCATVGRAPDADTIRRLAGGGLRDTTRLGASNPAMWTAIAKQNREVLLAACDRFTAVWVELREAIARGDADALGRLMEESRRLKRSLPAR